MDISNFSQDDFDPKTWINDTFENVPEGDETDALLESLVTKLQLYIEQVNTTIEQNCQKIVNNLPNVMSEIEALNQRVNGLLDKVSNVRREMEIIGKSTDESVFTLEKIDNLKNALENTKQALNEADNWSILAVNIEENFDSGNVEKITSILISMQQSLGVLSTTDDYEEKKMQLEGLKNRLEANVSPNVVRAFTTSNLDEALKYVKIFTEIERLPQLLKYYIKCQKGALCQYWKSVIDADQDLNLLEQLRSLYDTMLMNWRKQSKWCDEVFPGVNTVNMMIELYAEVLVDIDPSLPYCIDTVLKQHSQPLLLLLDFHQISTQFQQNLESLFVFNNESNKKAPDWTLVLKSLYAPYVPYASKYGTLERQVLDNYLWDCYLKLDLQTDLIDCIGGIGLTVQTVMNIARDALNRCIRFTRGCAIAGLVTALKGYFLKYIDKYNEVSNRLSQEIKGGENWQLLKSCLTFQQIIGELLKEIKTFDGRLLRTIRNQKNDSSIYNYIPFILNSTAQKDYENLLNSVAESDISLFQNVINVIEKLIVDLHRTTFKVLFQPISFHLDKTKDVWEMLNQNDVDLPDYSYSPLEYITQIGEHLITLPQHLEPFLSQENASLNLILQVINKDGENVGNDKGTYANVLLTSVAHEMCQLYTNQILNIRDLNSSGVRQLAADINYLGNVLEELGIGLAENLQSILTLFRLAADEYQSKCVGFPPKLVAAVRQIRKIPST